MKMGIGLTMVVAVGNSVTANTRLAWNRRVSISCQKERKEKKTKAGQQGRGGFTNRPISLRRLTWWIMFDEASFRDSKSENREKSRADKAGWLQSLLPQRVARALRRATDTPSVSQISIRVGA
jgi:hypothetical protein